MKIYEELLTLREAVVEKGGKVIRVTLDKKGSEILRKELEAPLGCMDRLCGMVIDQAKDCPTCGHGVV